MMKKILLITENVKELNDYIDVLNNLKNYLDFEANIVLLADIYFDHKQDEIVKKALFDYDIYRVKNMYNKPFKNYTFVEKIRLAKKFSKDIKKFIKNNDLVLSGVQTVFERIIYSQIKKNNVSSKILVYHRHLLFDDSVNTSSSKILHNSFIRVFLSFFDLDGLLIGKKAIGFADKYMVLGEINKNYLLQSGINEKDIYLVGSLEYDDIEQFVNKTNKIKNICFITSACEWIGDLEGENYQKEKIKSIIHYAKENQLNLTLRIHPRENFEKYEKLKKQYNFINLQYPSNEKLLKDLQKFDLIIGGFSTVLFEAMLIEKKVVFYSLENEEYRYKELLDNFDFPYITNIQKLNNVISKSYKIKKDKFITYDKNEKAIDRITKIILKELNA